MDNSWSFEELSRTQTSYLTHDYHRYPAKFIPQVAARLIKENSTEGDLIVDPFMGSGTTLIEAIVNRRRGYGSDINPVAVLIARAKTTPIDPYVLSHHVNALLVNLKADLSFAEKGQTRLSGAKGHSFSYLIPKHQRIDYWYPEEQKRDLAIILARINQIDDESVRTFLLCSFSNILKGCSRWMMKSVKPTRDKEKVIADAYRSFSLQTRRMEKKNNQLCQVLSGHHSECTADNTDARKLNIKNDEATLVVTSPPYVTSYEYADLHQLTALWLEYTNSLTEFRSKFIGSVQKEDDDNFNGLYSSLGKEIADKLLAVDRREGIGVHRYFLEMQQVFSEMYRVLKRRGRACIVIGNTDLKKVSIKNAEVFTETMEKIGFSVHDIIQRPIPSKILPLTRDEKTGKFAATAKADRLAYPTEYILIMEKK